jgi:hypothetical protein
MALAGRHYMNLCCCRPYDPIANIKVKCLAYGLDLGHCDAQTPCHCHPDVAAEVERGLREEHRSEQAREP